MHHLYMEWVLSIFWCVTSKWSMSSLRWSTFCGFAAHTIKVHANTVVSPTWPALTRALVVKHATLTCVFVKRVKQEIARAQIRSVRSVSSALRTDRGCKLLSHTLNQTHTHTLPRTTWNQYKATHRCTWRKVVAKLQTRRCFLLHYMNYNYFSPFCFCWSNCFFPQLLWNRIFPTSSGVTSQCIMGIWVASIATPGRFFFSLKIKCSTDLFLGKKLTFNFSFSFNC